MDDRPDLPKLNTFKMHSEDRINSCFCSLMIALALSAIVFGTLDHVVAKHIVLPLGSAVLAILLLFIAYAVLSKMHQLEIDDRGILAKRILGSRLIEWDDVVEVKIGMFSYHWQQIAIKAKTGSRVITYDDDPKLQACIWQNLRRRGKADLIELSDEAKSFWYDIPDTIPETMTWTTSRRMSHDEFGPIERVELRNDRLQVIEDGQLADLQLSEVADAEWYVEQDESATIGLLVGTASKPRLLRIPLFIDDPECVKLLLAIVRRLRDLECSIPLYIPREISAGMAIEPSR